MLACPDRVERIDVISADDMYKASLAHISACDIFIASAAVADFRPITIAEQKMKKTLQDTMTIEMVKNPDIVSAIAAIENRPFVVGFAAETHDVLGYAREKMQRKKLDMIIANDVSDTAIGFNTDHNAVTILTPDNECSLPEASKTQLAKSIVERISLQLNSSL
jgi:phosphopantothenoylcysteine decarboxylase / phosphopantothenate---cysteine ligase